MSMTKNPGYFEIAGLINKAGVGNCVAWSEIVARVEECNQKKPIKNWMAVRGSLQFLSMAGGFAELPTSSLNPTRF